MNVLAYTRICGPESMRYRANETNYQYGYRHICIYGCFLTANKVVFVVVVVCLFCFVLLVL